MAISIVPIPQMSSLPSSICISKMSLTFVLLASFTIVIGEFPQKTVEGMQQNFFAFSIGFGKGNSKCVKGTEFNKVIINVDADKKDDANKWDCKNGFFFCYQSALEGGNRMSDIWEVLKVKNVEGNTVAKKCNEYGKGSGIWHGFALFRDTNTENGTFLIPDKNGTKIKYTEKIVRNDIVIFSFSDNVIRLKPGENFVEINLNAENEFKPTVLTRESAIYRSNKHKGMYIRNGTEGFRSDLTEMDLSSPYKLFHQFAFNGGFWTLPYDVYGYGLHTFVRKMQYIRTKDCNINATIDMTCGKYEWKKVAPAAYNRTLANGTFFTTYEVMYGYVNYSYHKGFKQFGWEYFENSKEVAMKMGNDYPKYNYKPVGQGKHNFLQISKEDYQNNLMALFADCHSEQVIYKFRQYRPEMVVESSIDKIVDWSKDFEPLNNCAQKLLALSDGIPPGDRERKLKYLNATHMFYFYIGLKSKDGIEAKWVLAPEQYENFEHYIGTYWYGQFLFPISGSYGSLKKYGMTAKFREADEGLRKAMGIADVAVEAVVATLGVYQEIYECPTVTIYTPRIFGRVNIALVDSKMGSLTFAYEYAHTTKDCDKFLNPIASYELQGGGEKCNMDLPTEAGSSEPDISKLWKCEKL